MVRLTWTSVVGCSLESLAVSYLMDLSKLTVFYSFNHVDEFVSGIKPVGQEEVLEHAFSVEVVTLLEIFWTET